MRIAASIVALFLATPALAQGDAARGETVYVANCLACHGKALDGEGPAARALKPPPADFTLDAFWQGRTDAQVIATIRTGKPGTSMMAFGKLSDQELADVAAYLRRTTGH